MNPSPVTHHSTTSHKSKMNVAENIILKSFFLSSNIFDMDILERMTLYHAIATITKYRLIIFLLILFSSHL